MGLSCHLFQPQQEQHILVNKIPSVGAAKLRRIHGFKPCFATSGHMGKGQIMPACRDVARNPARMAAHGNLRHKTLPQYDRLPSDNTKNTDAVVAKTPVIAHIPLDW